MRRFLTALSSLLIAALLAGCAAPAVVADVAPAATAYVPGPTVVFYVAGDGSFVELYDTACPFVEEGNDLAKHLRFGFAAGDIGQPIPLCWALLWDNRVGVIIETSQFAISVEDLSRGPAPLPPALPNPNSTGV